MLQPARQTKLHCKNNRSRNEKLSLPSLVSFVDSRPHPYVTTVTGKIFRENFTTVNAGIVQNRSMEFLFLRHIISAIFKKWLIHVKALSLETGHLEVALTYVGKVLFYSPQDHSELWIERTVAEALNEVDADDMPEGYRTEAYNSHGCYFVDPSGKPERQLAEDYKKKAEEVENAGYYRFMITLRELAESYMHQANHIIADHKND